MDNEIKEKVNKTIEGVKEKTNDEIFEGAAKETLDRVRLDGMRAGAYGVLGTILKECNHRKATTYSIKKLCEKMLGTMEDAERKNKENDQQ